MRGKCQGCSSPSHVLLHQEHRRRRLDVEAAGIERDALSHQGHFRSAFLSPGEVDEPRGRRGGAADGVDHREILLQQLIADDALERGVVALCEMARRGFDPVGAEVVGRRVDQVAAEDDRLGDACHLVRIDAVRHREPDGLRRAGAVAVKIVAAEEPREGRERRVVGRVLEAIGALGQDAGQLAGEERVLPAGIRADAEHGAEDAAILVGKQAVRSRFRLKALRDGEGPRGRRQRRQNRGPVALGRKPQRKARFGQRGEEWMRHCAWLAGRSRTRPSG